MLIDRRAFWYDRWHFHFTIMIVRPWTVAFAYFNRSDLSFMYWVCVWSSSFTKNLQTPIVVSSTFCFVFQIKWTDLICWRIVRNFAFDWQIDMSYDCSVDVCWSYVESKLWVLQHAFVCVCACVFNYFHVCMEFIAMDYAHLAIIYFAICTIWVYIPMNIWLCVCVCNNKLSERYDCCWCVTQTYEM